jgi:hypothetical protein
VLLAFCGRWVVASVPNSGVIHRPLGRGYR